MKDDGTECRKQATSHRGAAREQQVFRGRCSTCAVTGCACRTARSACASTYAIRGRWWSSPARRWPAALRSPVPLSLAPRFSRTAGRQDRSRRGAFSTRPARTARRNRLPAQADWRHLGVMHPCVGYSDERIEIFLARGLQPRSRTERRTAASSWMSSACLWPRRSGGRAERRDHRRQDDHRPVLGREGAGERLVALPGAEPEREPVPATTREKGGRAAPGRAALSDPDSGGLVHPKSLWRRHRSQR
jgi:hypothetical protein